MVSQEDNHHEEKVCDVPEPVTEGDGGGQSRSPNSNNEAEGWNPSEYLLYKYFLSVIHLTDVVTHFVN